MSELVSSAKCHSRASNVPLRMVFPGLVVPIRRTRASRAARALFSSTKSLETDRASPFLRTSPFCPGLDDDATFRSKSFLRSRLVRSLRGSTSSSTDQLPEDSTPGDSGVARQDSDQPPSGGVDGTRGLTTVAEEDLEDWVDDFEAISLTDLPLEVAEAERVGLTESGVARTSGVSNESSGEADVNSGSASSASQQSQVHVRSRTISKTSRRSRKSSRRNAELRLILDFPLPPTFIPTPTKSKPPASQEINPVHDDGSVFYDRDPFRSEPIRDQEIASVNNPEEADTARVASSQSFYTANSRSSPSPTPSAHTVPRPNILPQPQPSVQPSSLPPLQLPFPNPSSSPSPQTQTETPSTARRSIKTLTRASATLKRFGNLTRETLRTSFRNPISELSVHRPGRTTRVAHASLDQLHQSSHQVLDSGPVLPDFQPEAFDISFPVVQTPHVTPRGSRVSRAQPSVQSFYASLEEFLTSHLHSDESNRRSRFLSAPTLLLTSERDPPKPAGLPIQVVPPTPPLRFRRTERPLPPLPREGYNFVDPSTLTESIAVTPAIDYRHSPIPPSPSWLSRNVRELEIALSKKAKDSSVSSSRSARGSDTEDASTVHFPKAVQTQTPSPPSSTSSSSKRLRGEVVLIRGRVNIQDLKSSQITLKSLTSNGKSPSEATVVLRTRGRSRLNRSGQSQISIPPNPPIRPRSRSSSVTKATITHYRRSLVETRKKCRPPRKEDTAKSCTGVKVSKARFIHSMLFLNPNHFHSLQTRSHSYRLAVTNKPTVSRLPPLEIVPVCDFHRRILIFFPFLQPSTPGSPLHSSPTYFSHP
ncbi:hypothetical protein BGW80DRAFT_1464091 [Lactifluus volemus]|nr:hypothetical protein BGW80DRAFT_1464091 [Lactifluus volemus]